MKGNPRVTIVGRPNVGKSTLFNRITKRRKAIVHPDPGVTRDVQRLDAEWSGVTFDLVDTGGLFSGIKDELIEAIEERALSEALQADAMIFVTDGLTGLTPIDIDVANQIRQYDVPAFLAVNKIEKRETMHADAEFYKLGFDRAYPISALNGQGVGDLLDAVTSVLPKGTAVDRGDEMRLAVVGRPNVGKSSLINALFGSDANIVDERPGTTRDSFDVTIRWHGRTIVLIDTAGIRKKSKTKDGLEAITALKSIDAINRADVVLLVLDADRKTSRQDVKVTSYAHKAGKGIVIVVNKWDLISDKSNATVPEFEEQVRNELSFVKYAPILFVSAKTHQRVSKVAPLAWRIRDARETRVPTSELNKFFEGVIARQPPPVYGSGNGKIYYVTQVGTAPPTFAFFVNKRAFFSRSYLRFLNNKLRDQYGYEGTVIRIKLVEKEHKDMDQ